MTWVRDDDQMPIHRKIAPLPDAAFRLHFEARCWASRNGTDGRIAVDELETVPARADGKRTAVKNAAELVRRRVWHRAEDPPCPHRNSDPPTCAEPGPDGWVIHDYLDYNPTAQQVRDEKRAKAERQKRWRDARRGGSASRNGAGDTSRDGPRDALDDASRNAPGDAAPRARVSRPAPSRPEGSGTGGARPEDEAPAARLTAAERADDGRAEDHDQPNGRTRVTPPDLTGLRATLATARTKAHRSSRGDPLEELRAATPDIAPLLEPDPAGDPAGDPDD